MLKYLMNIGNILRLIKTVKNVISRCVHDKDFTPTPQEWASVIDALIPLVGSKIIEIPGFDSSQIAKSLQDVKVELLA